jgi:hypothetical protein
MAHSLVLVVLALALVQQASGRVIAQTSSTVAGGWPLPGVDGSVLRAMGGPQPWRVSPIWAAN